ncbi:MAG: adenylate/guanylate cyclase domain-containing protein [Actinomycetota bacterium]
MHPVVAIHQPGHRVVYIELREPLVVGRECDGLDLADEQVSRRHLRLVPRDGEVVVTDLDSTNGTELDGQRISSSVTLRGNATIALGDTTIRRVASESVATGHHAGAITVVRPSELSGRDGRRSSIDRVAALVPDYPNEGDGVPRTMTIAFTDIHASTERLGELGDAAWFAALDEHNRTVREELGRFDGREVKSRGDGFMLAFTSVRRALSFAVSLQRRFAASADQSIRIRLGLHSGDVIVDRGGDLFGRHVNVAARIADAAAAGQILASSAARDLASGDAEVDFADGVPVVLKGFDAPHVVHEVRWSSPPVRAARPDPLRRR